MSARCEVNLLLEQDRAESGVESTDTLVLQHLAEAPNETTGVGRLRHEANTCGLQRAEGNIGKELGQRGGGEVHGGAVVGGRLVPKEVDGLLLEELITSKLERALEEVTRGCGAKTRQQRTGALLGDDLSDTTKETLVVCDGVELYSCLDAVWISISDAALAKTRDTGG